MHLQAFFLLLGIWITAGGAFGTAYPGIAIKINKAVVPKASYALLERVVPITPRLVRTWNAVGMVIGILLIGISFYLKLNNID